VCLAWEQKGALILKNFSTPRKRIYFLLPKDDEKGD